MYLPYGSPASLLQFPPGRCLELLRRPPRAPARLPKSQVFAPLILPRQNGGWPPRSGVIRRIRGTRAAANPDAPEVPPELRPILFSNGAAVVCRPIPSVRNRQGDR